MGYFFTETIGCDIENNCHPEADCRLDERVREYVCVCRAGYTGDGYVCMRSSGCKCGSLE